MKVLIAVDESEISDKVLDWYIENFHHSENELVLLHAAEQPRLPSMIFAGGAHFPAEEISKVMAEHNKKCNELDHHFSLKCQQKHLSFKVMIETTKDKPGPAILKKVESTGASMIVMGSHNQGLLHRTVLGSVSEYVMHHSKIPVLIYHG